MKTTIRFLLEIAVISAIVFCLNTWFLHKEKPQHTVSVSPNSAVLIPEKNEKNQSSFSGTLPTQTKNKEQPPTLHSLEEWVVFFNQKYGIRFQILPGVDTKKLIPQDFSRQPPAKAIPEIFTGYNFSLQYTVGKNKASSLQHVYVSLPGGTEELGPFSPSVSQTTSDQQGGHLAEQLQQALSRSPREAEERVAQILATGDEETRNYTVRLASEIGGLQSSALYEKLLAEDPSENVRAAAFDAIIMLSESEGIDLQSLVDAGLNDPSPLIVDRAQALREALESPKESLPPAHEEEAPVAGGASPPR